MILRNIQYDIPSAGYLLFAVFLLLVMFWFLHFLRRQFANHFNRAYTDQILIPHASVIYWTKAFLFCFAWIFAVIALMQPKGNEQYLNPGKQEDQSTKNEKRRKPHEMIFLLDASASMSVKDAHGGISRLEYAKEIGDEMISRLNGQNASLHAFTSESMQLSPSTLDYLFVRLMLRDLKINEGETEGTDLLKALKAIRQQYFPQPTNSLKTLVILTDGGDTHLESLKGPEKEKALEAILNVVNGAQEDHLRVYTIGLGSKQGKEIPGISFEGKPVLSAENESLLRKLSIRGRGEYYDANEENVVSIADRLFKSLAQDNPFVHEGEKIENQDESASGFDLYFQYPLFLAILCLLTALSLPANFAKPLRAGKQL